MINTATNRWINIDELKNMVNRGRERKFSPGTVSGRNLISTVGRARRSRSSKNNITPGVRARRGGTTRRGDVYTCSSKEEGGGETLSSDRGEANRGVDRLNDSDNNDRDGCYHNGNVAVGQWGC